MHLPQTPLTLKLIKVKQNFTKGVKNARQTKNNKYFRTNG